MIEGSEGSVNSETLIYPAEDGKSNVENGVIYITAVRLTLE